MNVDINVLNFMLASLKMQRETRYAVKVLAIQSDLAVKKLISGKPIDAPTQATFAEISTELQKSIDDLDALMDELITSMEKVTNG